MVALAITASLLLAAGPAPKLPGKLPAKAAVATPAATPAPVAVAGTSGRIAVTGTAGALAWRPKTPDDQILDNPKIASVRGKWPEKTMPPSAKGYLPILMREFKDVWATMPMKAAVAAQIEQETCASPKGKICWNPKTELKTDREYGFGLGQFTTAYKADGKTERFNKYEELKKLDKKLSSWKWEDRYNPEYQLRGIVVELRNTWLKIKFDTSDTREKVAFMLSAYNGGLGGVLQDRKLCQSKPDCDSSRWFDNVEKHSFKAKTKHHGYTISFFDTNRSYVRNIMLYRTPKYEPHTEYYLTIEPEKKP